MKVGNDNITHRISEITDIYSTMILNIAKECNEKTLYPKIENIEKCYSNMISMIDNLEDNLLSDIINEIDQKKVIKLYKKIYKEQGILLRTNRLATIYIQTEYRKIMIRRYILSPANDICKKLLLEKEGKKNIYPVDICLGIDKLPFKTSVTAMLKIAKIAKNAKSYQDAQEELLNSHRIKMDHVTISSITNNIGALVLNNDIQKANKEYDELVNEKIRFSKSSINEILYIQTDGIMVNTRQIETIDKDKKSGWHENKIGLIYASGDVRFKNRALVNGVYEDKHEIIKKEYTSYIGEVNIFKKLLFSCALRKGYGQYNQTVLISNGASWIRNMKDELFPDAQQILDFYHLSEKILDLGKLYFNKKEDKYLPWCNSLCAKFKQSNLKEAIKEIENIELKLNITN
ncbi:MAG: hypothetical protein LBT62_03915, partial [Deltaproteobacteria bacterium]|nr:hypothetical protein [Deltaproteobacteria bacterium]